MQKFHEQSVVILLLIDAKIRASDKDLSVQGEKVIAMKGKDILSVWDEASIHEIFHQTGLVDNNLPYKVKFENFVNGKLRSTFYKRLGLKHIAYFKPATIRLQVGTRVIGKYFFTYLQGHRSQIDTFQTNSFS